MNNQLNFIIAPYLVVAIITFQLFCGQLSGLEPGKGINQYLVDQWTAADGLPSNTINAISQTPDGYLWIATLNGLVRFDGMTFQKKSIHNSDSATPVVLYADKNGKLWIGTTVGLACYDWKTGQSETFVSENGFADDRIRTLKEDMAGNLWIGVASNYVYRFSNNSFYRYNEKHGLGARKIGAVIENRNGNLLFAGREKGVFQYKNERFSKFTAAGLEGGQTIISMCEDRLGELWIGTTGGLLRVTGRGTEKYTAAHGLSDNSITVILEDSERNLWVGTQAGLNRIIRTQDGGIAFEHVLESLLILSLFEDKEKSLWAGTFKSGVKRLKNGTFTSFEAVDAFKHENFLSLFEDRNGNIWLGTLSGKLFRFAGDRMVEVSMPPKLTGTGVAAIAGDSEGNLWLGTNGKGVFRWKERTLEQFTTRDGLADNMVTSIFKDSRGNLWFGTLDGVSVRRFATGGFESLKPGDGLCGKGVNNLIEDSERNIWIAMDKGITVLKGGNFAAGNRTHYLQGITVTGIYEDGDSTAGGTIFWIATHGKGLKRFQNGKFTGYSIAEGLTTGFIYRFFEDHDRYFWLMSSSGILRVSKRQLNDYYRGGTSKINCRLFGLSDGLKSLDFNNLLSGNSALKTSGGELWFITREGISIVNPAKILLNKYLPRPVIENIFVDDRPFSFPASAGSPIFEGIENLRFHFTAPTFLSPENVTFKYRLDGYEQQEIRLPAGAERVAHYSNIPPGNYTFNVIACNGEGICDQNGVAFPFILEARFYQTLFFKIAVFLFLLTVLAAAVYLYKKFPLKKKVRYKGSHLHSHYVDECIEKLKNIMEIEKAYKDSDLSLQSLAAKLSISSHQLSQLLNEKLKRNFADFINSYRIDEAKKILKSPEGSEQKIDALAMEVGFNTTVAFYRAFRKYTDMTPTQFKKKK